MNKDGLFAKLWQKVSFGKRKETASEVADHRKVKLAEISCVCDTGRTERPLPGRGRGHPRERSEGRKGIRHLTVGKLGKPSDLTIVPGYPGTNLNFRHVHDSIGVPGYPRCLRVSETEIRLCHLYRASSY
eukprot:2785480-Rhodomonas_salina.2